MRPDPEIEEVRAARRRISERCGHDLKSLFRGYQELERELRDSATAAEELRETAPKPVAPQKP
jgi:hypothetical protein